MLLQLVDDAFKWSDIDWLSNRLDTAYCRTEEVSFVSMFVGVGCIYLILQSTSTGDYSCVSAVFNDIHKEFEVELAEIGPDERQDEINHLTHLLSLNSKQCQCYSLDCFFTDAVQYVRERTHRAEAAVQRETKHLAEMIKTLNKK